MPKRTDISSILIIGSGPIVIGQACEFDYSGTQACRALREEGYRVILVNSNPATIMTDPEIADAVYVEPLTQKMLAKIIEKEKPDAVLSTMGGQTALNLSLALHDAGVFQAHGVELIGAKVDAIRTAEDRELFKQAMLDIGLKVARSEVVRTVGHAVDVAKEIGFPIILRPSFTLGGAGGGVAYNMDEFVAMIDNGLNESPVHQVLIEQSLIGWKEFELEVMRDHKDNCLIVCSIENMDPMGVHTGDSITVAPVQTLTDRQYQEMRDAALAIIRRVGVETGGSNVQFAVNPRNGDMIVIEMNPRVSRSSALASKATGFPIARIAAKLAVGLSLDEIPNDITKKTPASFEPTLDYTVVKIPRWNFNKFPQADPVLTTHMKSVGEVMALGRTFKEAMQKALRSLENGKMGFGCLEKGLMHPTLTSLPSPEEVKEALRVPTEDRIEHLYRALKLGIRVPELYQLTGIDPWFLHQLEEIVEAETELQRYTGRAETLNRLQWDRIKSFGFSDRHLGFLWNLPEDEVRRLRKATGSERVFKQVDTCAAEFEAVTPYFYSTFGQESDPVERKKPRVIILGSGPNRIGQGVEFDYCCVHGVMAAREAGYEAVMVNCNPETVSTDYDISDRLYFEPLTREDVLRICEVEQPLGVILQFGGQTPLKLAKALQDAGVPILGTSPDAIDLAEDRERFQALLKQLNLLQPANAIAHDEFEAYRNAEMLGYPVIVRPSYVLGGQGMAILYREEELRTLLSKYAAQGSQYPILIEKFLEDAIELDVDVLCDGHSVRVMGIMEHIEEAGVHSGDSACVLPPYSLVEDTLNELRRQSELLALTLNVVGLMNVQFAIRDETIYVIEVNPRASRTVPFVSKAVGIPVAKMATRVMLGERLEDLGIPKDVKPLAVAVKRPVFPFRKLPGSSCILGPEMKSTGEVMGIDRELGRALARAQLGSDQKVPTAGGVFISVRNRDKRAAVFLARQLKELGFNLLATSGTATVLRSHGLEVKEVKKVKEGRPHIIDHMKNGEVDLFINTPKGANSHHDSDAMREAAIRYGIPYFTTLSGAAAAIHAIEAVKAGDLRPSSLQDFTNAAESPTRAT